MAGDDALFHIKVTVNQSGWGENGEADAEIIAVTADSAVVRVDPNTRWDSEALHRLGVALEVAAQTLKRAERET